MNDQLVREIVEAVKRDDHGRFARLEWQCPDCGTKEPVNMEHALVKNGVWKPGAKLKSRCRTCHDNKVHVIVPGE